MGSSYDACYPAVTALARDGVAAIMTDTAELLHFRLPMLHGGDDLILVSQSGESAETVRAAEQLRARGDAPRIIAVTNDPGSSLARRRGPDPADARRRGDGAEHHDLRRGARRDRRVGARDLGGRAPPRSPGG